MGLFGPSLTEKIRRSATESFPQAQWTVDVDWSSGSKLHQLRGSLDGARNESETLQYAHDVWSSITQKFRLKPDDARDGLLDVYVTPVGGATQSTGING